jgi:2-iminobutanoate/2-iminopropanoate deaminase
VKIISTGQAPKPGGHYAQAVEHDGLIYVSGQLAVDPVTGAHLQGGVAEQCEQVLKNLAAILEAAGSGLAQVLKVTIYLTDIADWQTVNRIYAHHFGEHRPARTIVPVGALHHEARIEADCIAAVNPAAD